MNAITRRSEAVGGAESGAGARQAPGLWTLFVGFFYLGLTAFGGLAMIPYIRRYAVEKRGWLDETRFRQGVGLSQLIPGATAMQVAAYVGLRARGLRGALAAYTGFGLPAFLLMLGLSAAYAQTRSLASLQGLFAGLKVLVVALIAHAAVDCSQRYAETGRDRLLALAAALWLGFGGNPIAAVLALLAGCGASAWILPAAPTLSPSLASAQNGKAGRRYWLGLAGLCGVLLLLLFALGALSPRLRELAVLMLRVDVLAFGGGYVSVPFMLHEVVNARGWLPLDAFMDGIAFGQVTPGPIVMTAAFVGYYVAGRLGACVATVYVFAPSFLLLAAAAGASERVLGSGVAQRVLRGALAMLVGFLAATAGQFLLSAPWGLESGALGLAAFLALRAGTPLLWVLLPGTAFSWLLLR